MTNTNEQIIEQINLYLNSPKVQMKLSDKSVQAITKEANGDIEAAKQVIDALVFTRNLGNQF